MTYSTDAALQRLIDQQFPAAKAAGCFSPLAGLTGLTGVVMIGQQRILARREAPQPIPFVSRRREYQLLKRFAASGLVPQVIGRNQHWLLLEWLDGEVLDEKQFAARIEQLVRLLGQLHHQPLSGYRLQLLPLLESYWQQCQQRNCQWLRALRRLRQRGEPRPLRIAPLHMDVHAGNVLQCGSRLRLIDWEYAADGDIALELAAITAANPLNAAQCATLVRQYAADNQIDADALHRQMRRWQPWLRLLMASWYQLRAEQSGDPYLYQAAADAWLAV